MPQSPNETDHTAQVRATPQWQTIDGDTLETRLSELEPQAEAIQQEIEAIRALLQIPSLLRSGLINAGTKFSLIRVPDVHYQDGVLTGPTADVFKKCEALGLHPQITSEYYREDGAIRDGYKKSYQIKITFPEKNQD